MKVRLTPLSNSVALCAVIRYVGARIGHDSRTNVILYEVLLEAFRCCLRRLEDLIYGLVALRTSHQVRTRVLKVEDTDD